MEGSVLLLYQNEGGKKKKTEKKSAILFSDILKITFKTVK